jgi:hypothetical protein
MTIPGKTIAMPLTAGALIWVLAAARPLSPTKPAAWSEPASHLSGRLRVAEPKITADQHFQLTLELANRGQIPLAVQSWNPHVFTITLLNGAGKHVQPTSARVDIMSAPQWGVIPRRGYLGFPVSTQSRDRARGSHLDITTLIWKLSPGKYRICGEYSSGRAADFMGKPGKATIWQGKLKLPAVDIEVVEPDSKTPAFAVFPVE